MSFSQAHKISLYGKNRLSEDQLIKMKKEKETLARKKKILNDIYLNLTSYFLQPLSDIELLQRDGRRSFRYRITSNGR